MENPTAHLRRQRPDLFESPSWWRSGLSDIADAAAHASKCEAAIIGKSAGGRDIWCFTSGVFEPQRPTATISSAMGSDRPQAFYDPALRTRPAVVIIGSIHGGEVEGVAVCMDLLSVIETGRDLQGRERPELAGLLGRFRLAVIPCLNPDGRERAAIRHLNNAELEHLFLVQQGIMADGSLFRGRRIKEVQPIPKGFLRFMGGYYNDDGVNLQHDDFFGPRLAPENCALRELFLREMPDGFLTFHAQGGPPSLTSPDPYLAPGYRRKQSEAAFYIISRLTAAGFDCPDPERMTGPAWSFDFQNFFHHVCGALPMLCELSHGLRQCPCSLARILESGQIVVAAWLDYALRFGLRPASMEFYAPPPPA